MQRLPEISSNRSQDTITNKQTISWFYYNKTITIICMRLIEDDSYSYIGHSSLFFLSFLLFLWSLKNSLAYCTFIRFCSFWQFSHTHILFLPSYRSSFLPFPFKTHLCALAFISILLAIFFFALSFFSQYHCTGLPYTIEWKTFCYHPWKFLQ